MKRVALRIVIGFSFAIHSSLANFVFAEKQYEIFEYGETGHQIKFLMSQEEIDKIQRSKERANILKQQQPPSPKRWVETFEIGETGQIIEFPMNREEIEKEKQRIRKQKNQTSRVISDDEYEIIEMGDGHTISFKKN